MSSQRYSESRSFHEETRRGSGGYNAPLSAGINVPIQQSTTNFGRNINEQHVQERIRKNDTAVKWVNDPVSGSEKFRVNINIDGFSHGEVNARIEGNKLLVYGEHIENKNQSTTKKIIEKNFELPQGLDTNNLQITFPTFTSMQIDILSRHANVIIDDGRISSKVITDYDTSFHPLPRYTEEKTSTEHTSTRRIGGGYEPLTTSRNYSSYDRLHGDTNTTAATTHRNNTYSSNNEYRSRQAESPSRRIQIERTTDSFNNSTVPTNTYRFTGGDSQSRTVLPSTTRAENGNTYEKSYSETHREVHHQRSSPTSGVQSSHEVEHHRSGSPILTKELDGDRFRTTLNIGSNRGFTPPLSSRNVEVREFSRRIGNNNDSSVFTQGFNTDAFYRSAFQPQVFADEHGQNRIEMKLDVHDYQPNEIKVSMNGSDLLVQAEHNVDRPPTSSTRAYFFKQITLPPNTDLSSLSSQLFPDGNLHITAKLFNGQQASIKHN